MSEAPRVGHSMLKDREIDRQALGTRLKEVREYLELSQDEIAKMLDVPRSAVSLMETGQRKVEAIELKRLAAIYQRPIGFFTGEQGAPPPVPETVEHLARTAAKLSDRDREELLRFAEFLQTRHVPARSGR
jgi:transcriptional regulator with XRE-family HTH domain